MDSDKKLKVFRDKIDEIDNSIVDLIKQRMSVVQEVGLHKENIKDKFFIRSAREADMMKDLIEKLDGVINKKAVFNIWRSLIVSANICEQSLEVIYYNPQGDKENATILQNYYANLVSISEMRDISQLDTIDIRGDSEKSKILAVGESEAAVLERIMKGGMKIFAKVGALYLIANKPIEKSEEDRLVYFIDGEIVECDNEIDGEFWGVVPVC
ncbi:MAG: chorismate mutase [Rickettsiales bacterium]|nr:chorismate mutase [Rickettsiales bacterium]